jgi:hypothetical protein
VPQSLSAPRQVKVPQILLDDGRHRHAQRSRKILGCHGLLLCQVGKKTNQACSQILRVPRLIKFDCQFFPICHLSKIRQVGAYNRHAISARQVCNPAAACR